LISDDRATADDQQKENNAVLDLEYVQLNVPKILTLFNKVS